MTGRLPLSALLSKLLVAYIIELDDAFEHEMPHRTTIARTATVPDDVPWLVSVAMWWNFLQFVDDGGTPVRRFARRARLAKDDVKLWVTRLSGWWGYIAIAPDPADERPKPPRAEWIVRPTTGGRRAAALWRSLESVIDERWRIRFGDEILQSLRRSLVTAVDKLDAPLPGYLPVLGHGLFTRAVTAERALASNGGTAPGRPLGALLSHLLFAIAVEFEAESELSLAICENVMRALTEDGVRLAELPVRTGVSKEAVSASIAVLERHGYAVTGAGAAGSRANIVRLTANGLHAQRSGRRLLGAIEERWRSRCGDDALGALQGSLDDLLDQNDGDGPLLARGLLANPGGWRARTPYRLRTAAMIRDPRTALPHYPMILHRGGWPDGS